MLLLKKYQNYLIRIRSSRPSDPECPVRVPGDRGRSNIDITEHTNDELVVSDMAIDMLTRMAKGENIAELSNNPLFN